MAFELLDDVRRLDAQLAESKQRIAEAVTASKATLTDVLGVGPIIAAMCIGFTGHLGHSESERLGGTSRAPTEHNAPVSALSGISPPPPPLVQQGPSSGAPGRQVTVA